jgi:Na+/proline symporter
MWYAVLGITWVVALGVALLVKIWQRRRNQPAARRKRNIPWSRRRTAYLLGFAVTLLAAAVYLKYAGVYTEVPADFWFHLMRVNWEHGIWRRGV